MAGSLSHVLHGWSLIENMGDAQEAVEEMLWLILHTLTTEEAELLLQAKFYPMCKGELKPDGAFAMMKKLMGEDE